LYFDYEVISSDHLGWTLEDIKGMSLRERDYWVAVRQWRIDRG
jgi:hypothetical protein